MVRSSLFQLVEAKTDPNPAAANFTGSTLMTRCVSLIAK
jgi:hypothetical protein